jgi:beta-xylosidase
LSAVGLSAAIFWQTLAADGLSLSGEAVQLISNDQDWEGRVVEAPAMYARDRSYFLFFSGNNYAGADYAVGYAACQSALGPCQDAAENPILASKLKDGLVIGPGHQSILQVGEQTWMVYHAWEVLAGGCAATGALCAWTGWNGWKGSRSSRGRRPGNSRRRGSLKVNI